MRVLFANDNLIGGGVEKLLNDILPLINRRYECDLLIISLENQKYYDSLTSAGIKVYVIPTNCKNHISRIRYIRKFIREGGYDIVHASEFPMFYYCSLAKQSIDKNVLVMTEHDTHNRRRDIKALRMIERKIYGRYDKIISISPETENALKNWLGIIDGSSKFITIYNGVNINAFKESIKADRNEYFRNLADDDVILCMVGRLTYKKNHAFMLEVLKMLPNKYKLCICGDGELLTELTNKVHAAGLQDRVCFTGFVQNVGEIIKMCDLMVIPSKWEGFGLISIEAFACGVPVICSDVPGLSEVVGDAGIKVKPEDADSFTQAILELDDDTYKFEIVNKGYEQCEKYDVSVMKDNYMKLYEDLLGIEKKK